MCSGLLQLNLECSLPICSYYIDYVAVIYFTIKSASTFLDAPTVVSVFSYPVGQIISSFYVSRTCVAGVTPLCSGLRQFSPVYNMKSYGSRETNRGFNQKICRKTTILKLKMDKGGCRSFVDSTGLGPYSVAFWVVALLNV